MAFDITEVWEFIAKDNPLPARRVREEILDDLGYRRVFSRIPARLTSPPLLLVLLNWNEEALSKVETKRRLFVGGEAEMRRFEKKLENLLQLLT